MCELPLESNTEHNAWRTIPETRIQSLTRFLSPISLRDLRGCSYDEGLAAALMARDRVVGAPLEGCLDCCLDSATMVS